MNRHKERHALQHQRISETKAAYERAPQKTGADKMHRRELGKKAWWALTFHMRQQHGPIGGSAPFLRKTYQEVEAWHQRLHNEEEHR